MRNTNRCTFPRRVILVLSGLAIAARVVAAPAHYTIDPEHTYPSFEADHLGISIWRGKMTKTTGSVMLDTAAGTGTIAIDIDLNSIDFGHDKLNAWAVGPEFFDTAKYPQATYRGRLTNFVKGRPTQVVGDLTLHGITRPVTLTINSIACKPHPLLKRELCGADALATLKRDDFRLDAGKAYGFSMDVTLRIQVEAVKNE